MPSIHLIPNLPAALVVARFTDGEVLVDAGQPWRRILDLARALLPHDQGRTPQRLADTMAARHPYVVGGEPCHRQLAPSGPAQG